jgi:hypothetical protein
MDSSLVAFVFKETCFSSSLWGKERQFFAGMNKKEIGFRSQGTYDV